MNKRLLRGRAGAPDNYELSLVLMDGDYTTPRHKHNFDQVRYMVEGEFGYGRSKDEVQQRGTIGYFPEGVSYEQRRRARSVGASPAGRRRGSAGFMHYEQLGGGAPRFQEASFPAASARGRIKRGPKAQQRRIRSDLGKDGGPPARLSSPAFRTPISQTLPIMNGRRRSNPASKRASARFRRARCRVRVPETRAESDACL
ncbi:MAG: hypothetical protein R3C55_05850 [Parvularculaceae bacterium]